MCQAEQDPSLFSHRSNLKFPPREKMENNRFNGSTTILTFESLGPPAFALEHPIELVTALVLGVVQTDGPWLVQEE